MKERFAEIDRQASELNVEIQALEAQLVAIENYYRVVALRAEDPPRGHPASPCATCAPTIEELRGAARQAARGDRRRRPRRDAAAGGIGEAERETTEEADRTLLKRSSRSRSARRRA